ncbi:zinc ribbon domain-containing protein [Lysinibacillus sp. BW-2-10]|uniref:zinc ribbon domain-containing protein n=1 Tax=Lysinibacillus sp. BW-2-10 TaxID=2590030 RepID=UPI00117F818E|nr:zinc ribbon domain-containing protein [Lysinibacillus sp. BW-2-10]TSI10097.1 zinc ribbon domain-containing protein [Lysinibacillus sp. BW-2-10]
MYCIHCSEHHPKQFVYCPNSAQKIYEPTNKKFTYNMNDFCLSCGVKNDRSYAFCTYCGTQHLTKTEKKIGINKLLETTIPEIKLSTVNKREIKAKSEKSLQFLKRNKLLFVPILVTFLLLILSTFVIKSSLSTFVEENLNTQDEELLLIAALVNADILENLLYEELDVRVDIPNMTSIPTMISLYHNAKVNFNMTFGEDGYSEETSGELNNLFSGLLFIPILSLAIGGIVYGRMARHYNWGLYKGILYSVGAYTLVLTIVSLFARKSYKETFEAFFAEATLGFKISASIIDMLFTSLLLSTIVFGFFAIVSYYGKSVAQQLYKERKEIQYAVFAIAITLIGGCVHYVSSLAKVKDLTSDIPSSLDGLLAIYVSIITWFLAMFGKMNMTATSEFSELQSETYRWFFGNNDENILLSFMEGESITMLPPIVLTLLLIALVGASGYTLFNIHQLKLKETAIFASIFTLLQCFIIFLISVNLSLDLGGDLVKLSWNFSIISAVLLTFILSFASFYSGGFVRKQLTK